MAPTTRSLPARVAPFARRRRRVQLGRNQLAGVQLLTVAVMLVTWQLSADFLGTVRYTSSPLDIVEELRRWHATGVLWTATRVTLIETIGGFVIGAVAGAMVGFVLGWGRRLGEVVEPLIILAYAAPKVSIAPLFILWFGIGIASKALFAALLVFFLVFFTTFRGARQVDRELLSVARVLGARKLDVWLRIAVPHSAIWVFAGLRLALPYALIGAVVAEFLAARTGLGFLIREASSVFNTAGVYTGIVLLMFIASVLLASLQRLERRVLRWQSRPLVEADQA